MAPLLLMLLFPHHPLVFLYQWAGPSVNARRLSVYKEVARIPASYTDQNIFALLSRYLIRHTAHIARSNNHKHRLKNRTSSARILGTAHSSVCLNIVRHACPGCFCRDFHHDPAHPCDRHRVECGHPCSQCGMQALSNAALRAPLCR